MTDKRRVKGHKITYSRRIREFKKITWLEQQSSNKVTYNLKGHGIQRQMASLARYFLNHHEYRVNNYKPRLSRKVKILLTV